mmetsp:Transcript_12006/g.35148  ORF Transcript_12006/g.35148 Transcript_12006/m.35148 type:complete len:323 (+) Transcript_12006:30-998(+)
MSLNFLGKKSFHPSAPQNVAKLWKAEEKKRLEAEKKNELAREHAMEESRRHARSLMAARRGEVNKEPPASMDFMYQKPPGLAEASQRKKVERPADKEAERFPLLKDAPRAGVHELVNEVQHQPFGVKLNNVQCRACGQWGHSVGDRECPKRNELTAGEVDARARLDPVGRLHGSEASGAELRWEIKGDRGAGGLGAGVSAQDANQQYVLGDMEEAAALQAGSGEPGLSELDPELLATLSEKQQRQLLKMYRKELAGREGGGEGGGEGGVAAARLSEAAPDAHERRPRVLHDGADVCEVDVDQAGLDDDVGDARDALAQDLVG